MKLFDDALKVALETKKISERYGTIIRHFHEGFIATLKERFTLHEEELFVTYLRCISEQYQHPYPFEPFHRAIRKPFDYYNLGIAILSPLVDRKASSILGKEHLVFIKQALEKGENVIFFANHQTEADPIAISILFGEEYAPIAEEMIFVAGERVTTDPLAVPFSLGRNLLCIYSKRYIDFPPEDKRAKQLHNQHTMEKMSSLLREGGKAIYVAPSGGRDRPNAEGVFEVAPFDPSSIEMFYLMTQKAGRTTHFYPLSLKTHSLLPPPETVQIELGEPRKAQDAVIHLAIGERIAMEDIVQSDMKDKHERRRARAGYICDLVRANYLRF